MTTPVRLLEHGHRAFHLGIDDVVTFAHQDLCARIPYATPFEPLQRGTEPVHQAVRTMVGANTPWVNPRIPRMAPVYDPSTDTPVFAEATSTHDPEAELAEQQAKEDAAAAAAFRAERTRKRVLRLREYTRRRRAEAKATIAEAAKEATAAYKQRVNVAAEMHLMRAEDANSARLEAMRRKEEELRQKAAEALRRKAAEALRRKEELKADALRRKKAAEEAEALRLKAAKEAEALRLKAAEEAEALRRKIAEEKEAEALRRKAEEEALAKAKAEEEARAKEEEEARANEQTAMASADRESRAKEDEVAQAKKLMAQTGDEHEDKVEHVFRTVYSTFPTIVRTTVAKKTDLETMTAYMNVLKLGATQYPRAVAAVSAFMDTFASILENELAHPKFNEPAFDSWLTVTVVRVAMDMAHVTQKGERKIIHVVSATNPTPKNRLVVKLDATSFDKYRNIRAEKPFTARFPHYYLFKDDKTLQITYLLYIAMGHLSKDINHATICVYDESKLRINQNPDVQARAFVSTNRTTHLRSPIGYFSPNRLFRMAKAISYDHKTDYFNVYKTTHDNNTCVLWSSDMTDYSIRTLNLRHPEGKFETVATAETVPRLTPRLTVQTKVGKSGVGGGRGKGRATRRNRDRNQKPFVPR